MAIHHIDYKQPESGDVKIWRYMDFTKLMSLLDSYSHYFARPDRFNDPFEGSWPVKNKITIDRLMKKHEDMDTLWADEYFKKSGSFQYISKNEFSKQIAISCWHMNEFESAAMWKLYTKSNESIAIQTTYSKLRLSLWDQTPLEIGLVLYIDYENDEIEHTLFSPFMHKRKSFEHEQEVRAIVTIRSTLGPMEEVRKYDKDCKNKKFTIQGVEIPIAADYTMEKLIDKIHINPEAPDWVLDLVGRVVKKYNFEIEVVRSDLNKDPLF